MRPTDIEKGLVPTELGALPGRRSEVGGLPVIRSLPRSMKRTVGAWCLVDRFGPVDPRTVPMRVPPHPHIGLHTVTWLLDGELLHRDSLGNEQLLLPGQVNVMTAGRGISHSEETPDPASATLLDGYQLWIAQPEWTRHGPSGFEHHGTVPVVELGANARASVFMDGGLAGAPQVDTRTIGMDVAASGPVEVPVQLDFEHAVVVVEGEVRVDGVTLDAGMSIHLVPGRSTIRLDASEGARLLVLGGPPLPERVLMWWNFVARNVDELRQARVDWDTGAARFGTLASPLGRVAAPAFPSR